MLIPLVPGCRKELQTTVTASSHCWSYGSPGTQAVGLLDGSVQTPVDVGCSEWMQINGNTTHILYLKTEGVEFVRPQRQQTFSEDESAVRFDLFPINPFDITLQSLEKTTYKQRFYSQFINHYAVRCLACSMFYNIQRGTAACY